MTKGERTIGEPLQQDELVGQNGYVDRISSGLTLGDVIRLMLRRGCSFLIIFGFFILLVPLLMFPMDPAGVIILAFLMLFFLGFVGAILLIVLLCTAKSSAKMLGENNYILVMKDRLVVQSQSDMMMTVLRNEIPLSKISQIEKIPPSYIRDRRSKTNICTRIFMGGYLPPVGGLYPIASRQENLMAIGLKKPHEIHCSGRNPNGMVQFGDKREYVKEIVVSVDGASQRKLAKMAASNRL